MAAVTQRRFLCLLAATEEYILRFRRLIFDWLEVRPFVAAIAIGLVGRTATGAPHIGFTRLYGFDTGRFLGNFWTIHGHTPIRLRAAF